MDARILLTGATGYIGGRLLRSLEEGGHAVRCLARRPANVAWTRPSREVVAGVCLDEASLDRTFAGVRRIITRIFRGLLRRIAQRAESGRDQPVVRSSPRAECDGVP
jgi:uncharacterized protein YbjT (DUF2867 family)